MEHNRITNNRIVVETGLINNIPVLISIPNTPDLCPVVFYVPGFTGQKSNGLSLAYRLGQAGSACISIDPIYHGDRSDDRLLQAAQPEYGGIYPPESGLDVFMMFMRVIQQSALDVQTLLEAFADDARININQAGITGMSMGAFVSFLAFASIPQIKVAVPMMGIPTFAQRWLDLLDECSWSNPDWKQALNQVADKTQEHTTFIQRIDPAQRLRQKAPNALLLMNGDFDTDAMKTFTLDWYRAAKSAWDAQPESLQWNVYPVGHTVTPQMEMDAVSWFERHLL